MNYSICLPVILMVLMIGSISHSQEIYRSKKPIRLDATPIYHKTTGAEITMQQLADLAKPGEPITLIPVIDRYGRLISQTFDPDGGGFRADAMPRFEPGYNLPPFSMVTLDGDTIHSDDRLADKKLVFFHLGPDSPMHNPDAMKELESLLEEHGKLNSIESLIVLPKSKQDLSSDFLDQISFSKIVVDGGQFWSRYRVASSPVFMILDEVGRLGRYLDGWDPTEILDALKQ